MGMFASEIIKIGSEIQTTLDKSLSTDLKMNNKSWGNGGK